MSRGRVYAPQPDAAPPRAPAGGGGGAQNNQTLILAIIIIVLVAGGYALWSIYGSEPHDASAPVIEAPERAWKERYAGDGRDEEVVPTAEIDRALEGRPTEARASVSRAAENRPTAAAAVAAPAGPPATGAAGYLVQIAALQSEPAANAAWNRLSAKDPALFAGVRKDIQRADLGAKGVYFRVRAGTFTDRAEASRFCDRFKSTGQDCIVVAR